MSDDLLERLRRLGLTRGARDLKPAAGRKAGPPATAGRQPGPGRPGRTLAQQAPGGRLEQTELGSCYVVDRVYPLSHRHGRADLAALLGCRPAAPARFLGDARLGSLAYEDFLFLDTETTGLAGASTLAFMVGVAFYERGAGADALVVRQFFLRDHGDEGAMLLLLDELLRQKAGLVTFNGRTFDVPLLRTRYLMNRTDTHLDALPHLDLLPPSRRLWRRRIGSVALSNLEKELLGVRRTEEDIPGWLIPGIYNEYVRSGDASQIGRIFYHNQIDMLSMVTLAAEISQILETPLQRAHPLDALSVGKWQVDVGDGAAAEETLRQTLQADVPLETYHETLRQLALLLKRADRHSEAMPLWQQWAATAFDTVEAHVELAKYYEWRAGDLAAAAQWTRGALELIARWPAGQAVLVRPELEHRLHRLERKLADD